MRGFRPLKASRVHTFVGCRMLHCVEVAYLLVQNRRGSEGVVGFILNSNFLG